MLHRFSLLVIIVSVFTGMNSSSAQFSLPDGARISTADSKIVYLVIDRERHAISDEAYNNLFREKDGIKIISDNAMETLPEGLPIKTAFLCKSQSPEVYLVLNQVKHHLAEPEILNIYSFNWTYIKNVTDADLKKYKTGKPIESLYLELQKLQDMPKPCGNRDGYPKQ